ncbi:glycosyltransferase family 32 protein [uncultured Eubacterium sp.]|uniref:glycosyltransferase family 32 protein n=1 Tax=uncultured Eubacterium sp. TaxID=165185 RepID=UPI0026710FB3|nr:glycosyltransferase [uncultured Eubacterium sp.]
MTRNELWSFCVLDIDKNKRLMVKHLIESDRNIVHYCWFGKENISERDLGFIENNKRFFKNYDFIIWNEQNFDINGCNFARQAYEMGEYAFVSDYVRAKVLYQYGGIYLDTDVKVIRNFPNTDSFEGFAAFERRKFLGTAVLGCKPKNKLIGKLVDYYENNDFISEDGNMDIVANVSLFTDIMLEKGLVLGGGEQEVCGIKVFSREVFFPKKLSDTEFRVTKETAAIHYCNNSWLSEREKKRGKSKLWIEVVRPLLQSLRKILQKVIGKEKTRNIEIKLRNKLK